MGSRGEQESPQVVVFATSLKSRVEGSPRIVSFVSIVAGVSLAANPVIRNATICTPQGRAPPES
jgi:hypothetical protein